MSVQFGKLKCISSLHLFKCSYSGKQRKKTDYFIYIIKHKTTNKQFSKFNLYMLRGCHYIETGGSSRLDDTELNINN